MQSHAQYELRHYLHLIKASRDIVTKIHPHYEMMYPAGVCQMTALDPELSNAPLAMKIEFCDRILQTQPSGIAKVAPPRPARPCFTTQRFYNLFTRDIKQRRGSRKIFFFTWADFGSVFVEGYVHGYEHIRLGSLKHLLPMNAGLPELLDITFEGILPGRQQHNQRYTKHPTILKFLAETSSDNHDTFRTGGYLRVKRGTRTWQSCEGKHVIFARESSLERGAEFADVLKDHERRQATSMQAVSYCD